METEIALALIGTVGSVLTSALGFLILYFQRQTHHTFNSKMDEALKAQRSLGDKEGRLSEQSNQRTRKNDSHLSNTELQERTHRY